MAQPAAQTLLTQEIVSASRLVSASVSLHWSKTREPNSLLWFIMVVMLNLRLIR